MIRCIWGIMWGDVAARGMKRSEWRVHVLCVVRRHVTCCLFTFALCLTYPFMFVRPCWFASLNSFNVNGCHRFLSLCSVSVKVRVVSSPPSRGIHACNSLQISTYFSVLKSTYCFKLRLPMTLTDTLYSSSIGECITCAVSAWTQKLSFEAWFLIDQAINIHFTCVC